MADQEQADTGSTGADPAMVSAESAEDTAAFEEMATAADSKGTPAAVATETEGAGTGEAEEDAPVTKDAPKPKETPAASDAAAVEADGAKFWDAVAVVHPLAEKDVDDPRFAKFTESNPYISKMAKSKSPYVAIEVLNAYYEARDAGQLDGESPAAPAKPAQAAPAAPSPAPAATGASAVATLKLADLDAIVVSDADGVKRTLGDIRGEAGDEYIATIAAVARQIIEAQQPKSPEASSELAELRQQVAVMNFWSGLEDLQPGGRQLVTSKECRDFVQTQPPSIQRLFRSNDPADVAYVADLYAKTLKNDDASRARGAAMQKKARTDALHSETVRGKGKPAAPNAEGSGDGEAETDLFEEAVKKADAREQAKRRQTLR